MTIAINHFEYEYLKQQGIPKDIIKFHCIISKEDEKDLIENQLQSQSNKKEVS